MATSRIFLDTSVLLRIRSYHLAYEELNQPLLDILDSHRLAYEALVAAPSNGYVFLTSEMDVVEMMVTSIKNALYEYARLVYHMPADSFYSDRTTVIGKLRPEFNKQQLGNAVADLKSWSLMGSVNILPDVLGPHGSTIWRRKQEILFRVLPEFESLEAQDAHVLASALAAEATEIWCADTQFRRAYNRLRNGNVAHRLVAAVRSVDPVLFPALNLPPITNGPHAS
jgi:hypothetical protein